MEQEENSILTKDELDKFLKYAIHFQGATTEEIMDFFNEKYGEVEGIAAFEQFEKAKIQLLQETFGRDD